MARIAVVGSANTDMFVMAERLPGPGETVMGGRFYTAAGGKGANQAVAASRAGAEVAFIARVGNDSFGKETADNLRREGIRVDHVTVDPEEPSGVALIVVGSNGENLIAVAPGANASLSPDDVEAARGAISSSDFVLVQLEVPLRTVRKAMEVASACGVPVVLNPSPVPAEDISGIALCASVLVPNMTECGAILGREVRGPEETAAAAGELVRKGVGAVVATLGVDGAVIAAEGKARHVPGYRVDAVDTVGAGDTFSGYLAAFLADGRPLEEAVDWAQAAAALSSTRSGAQPSIPRVSEVRDFMDGAGRR